MHYIFSFQIMHIGERELILHLIRRDKAASRATLLTRRPSRSTRQQFVSSLLQLDLSCRWCLKYIYMNTHKHICHQRMRTYRPEVFCGLQVDYKQVFLTSDNAGACIISACKTSQIFVTFWPVILLTFKNAFICIIICWHTSPSVFYFLPVFPLGSRI